LTIERRLSKVGHVTDLPTGSELRALLDAPRSERLEAIVVRLGNGRHARPREGRLTRAEGLVGDRWGAWQPVAARQLTLMDVRVVRLLLAHRAVRVGAQGALVSHEELDLPGDNLVVDLATSTLALPAGTRLRVGTSLIETNDVPHLGCKKFEARFGEAALAWVNDPAHRDLRLRGLHAVVIEDGAMALGERVGGGR